LPAGQLKHWSCPHNLAPISWSFWLWWKTRFRKYWHWPSLAT